MGTKSYDRVSVKKLNVKSFLNYQYVFLSFYKSIEESLHLELNVTYSNSDVILSLSKACNASPLLCFKISQHIEDSRKVLYIYFVCEKEGWNTKFCGFWWFDYTTPGPDFPASSVALDFTDIKNKILDFFKI